MRSGIADLFVALIVSESWQMSMLQVCTRMSFFVQPGQKAEVFELEPNG